MPTKRTKRTQKVAIAVLAALALFGLGYQTYWALKGSADRAIIGATIALGSGLAVYGYRRLAQITKLAEAAQQRWTDVQKRLDAMELLLEESAFSVDLSALGRGDPSILVAANTTDNAFPRIAPAPGAATTSPSVVEPNESAQEGNSEEPMEPAPAGPIERHSRDDLRSMFRESISLGDFAAALAVGEEILTVYPDSAMAAQFQTIRDNIRRRASNHAKVI